MCKCKKHNEEFIIIKVCLSCEKERQENSEQLFRQRMFPFPHIRPNYNAIARSLIKVEPMPGGALPIYDKEED
jgi:hypothetical protein